MRSMVAAVAALMLLPVMATAQSKDSAQAGSSYVIENVEYISGKDGFADKMKGELVVTQDALVFRQKDKSVFAIPMVSVTEIGRQTDIRDGSVGKKLLFGSLAGSRKQEFVNISAETDSTAEGMVFKVKQGTSQNAATKIRFYAKKARAAAGLSEPKTESDAGTGSTVGQ